ncbi:MAG: ArsC family reductase [Gammaproteobacteria bacterium]
MSDEITIYGIKNCDTVKKACKYLSAHNTSYQFIDFRQNPLSADTIETWIESIGWEALVNKRSTTYRSLSESQKSNITIELLIEQPTLIKRPVLVSEGVVFVGFKEEQYSQFIS